MPGKFFEKVKKVFGGEEQEGANESQLVDVVQALRASPEVLDFVAQEIFDKNPDEFSSLREVKKLIKEADEPVKAFHLARLVDKAMGSGVFRTISLLGDKERAGRSLLKILRKNKERTDFESRAEGGLYLGILENYDVQWSLEKAARDAWQNFFDGNNQTLDGIKLSVFEAKKAEKSSYHVRIDGAQTYDWRELAHLGATTKAESTRTAGGFGEGTKVLALVLLRDYGAKKVEFYSDDWGVEFYLSDVPRESYREPTQGLFIRKKKREKQTGNGLELVFEGEGAEGKAEVFEKAREFFYGSDNRDFRGASYDNEKTGGFKVLPQDEKEILNKKGHLYIAGQRVHYNSRDEWDKVDNLNIWVWEKILLKDRDRGLVTREEFEKKIIPFIVDSMSKEDKIKSVYDFEPLWTRRWSHEASYELLESIVLALEKEGVILKFEAKYLADNLPFGAAWISQLLKQEGYEMCPGFMSKIGMKTTIDKFKELQSHARVEAEPNEEKKVALLRRLAQELGFPEEDLKEIWLFSAKDEKNIFHGQYNSEFYWLAKEVLAKSLLDAIHTYVHEIAHKAGPHGNPQFEYTLQEAIKKIQKFILENKTDFDVFEKEWAELSKDDDKK